MFTGIVENVGEVTSLEEKKDSWLLQIKPLFHEVDGMEAGASLSVNGCCLTCREDFNGSVSFDLLDETLKKTNLGSLKPGSLVNLERSLSFNGRVGGHFVTGHIDVCGQICVFEERGKNLYLEVKVPDSYKKYLVDKGCIAMDGCSLTVCEVEDSSFAVWLIPHTLAKTNLLQKKTGDEINLEFDLLAKYVEKLSASVLEKNKI